MEFRIYTVYTVQLGLSVGAVSLNAVGLNTGGSPSIAEHNTHSPQSGYQTAHQTAHQASTLASTQASSSVELLNKDPLHGGKFGFLSTHRNPSSETGGLQETGSQKTHYKLIIIILIGTISVILLVLAMFMLVKLIRRCSGEPKDKKGQRKRKNKENKDNYIREEDNDYNEEKTDISEKVHSKAKLGGYFQGDESQKFGNKFQKVGRDERQKTDERQETDESQSGITQRGIVDQIRMATQKNRDEQIRDQKNRNRLVPPLRDFKPQNKDFKPQNKPQNRQKSLIPCIVNITPASPPGSRMKKSPASDSRTAGDEKNDVVMKKSPQLVTDEKKSADKNDKNHKDDPKSFLTRYREREHFAGHPIDHPTATGSRDTFQDNDASFYGESSGNQIPSVEDDLSDREHLGDAECGGDAEFGDINALTVTGERDSDLSLKSYASLTYGFSKCSNANNRLEAFIQQTFSPCPDSDSPCPDSDTGSESQTNTIPQTKKGFSESTAATKSTISGGRVASPVGRTSGATTSGSGQTRHLSTQLLPPLMPSSPSAACLQHDISPDRKARANGTTKAQEIEETTKAIRAAAAAQRARNHQERAIIDSTIEYSEVDATEAARYSAMDSKRDTEVLYGPVSGMESTSQGCVSGIECSTSKVESSDSYTNLMGQQVISMGHRAVFSGVESNSDTVIRTQNSDSTRTQNYSTEQNTTEHGKTEQNTAEQKTDLNESKEDKLGDAVSGALEGVVSVSDEIGNLVVEMGEQEPETKNKEEDKADAKISEAEAEVMTLGHDWEPEAVMTQESDTNTASNEKDESETENDENAGGITHLIKMFDSN